MSHENSSRQRVALSGNVIQMENSTIQVFTGAVTPAEVRSIGGLNVVDEPANSGGTIAKPHAGGRAMQATSVRWLAQSGRDPLPPEAILAGEDPDGDRLYVGRAYHDDNQLPAKVVPNKAFAYVSNAGQVVRKEAFEVLCCEGGVSWVRPENGSVIPAGAIVGGRTSSGNVLYIGRGYSPTKQMMGKIVPGEQTLYIAYGGWEYPTKQYEFLVEN